MDAALHLLLADDDGAPALPDGLPPDAVAAESAALGALSYREDGASPDSLPDQRWGVVAPAGPAGDALLAALAPLIRRRRDEQGAEVVVHRWPADAAPTDAARWRRQVFDPGTAFAQDVPRYVVLLGDLDALPVEVGAALQADTYVGRLPLDPAGVEAYAAKLATWESAPRTPPQARIHVVNDGSGATRAGATHLADPAQALLSTICPVQRSPAAEPSRDGFRDALRADAPTALLSISHGRGTPKTGWADLAEKRRLQGAPTCGKDGALTADDVASGPVLPGGLWFLLACYGGGTPATSAYAPWLAELARGGAFGAPLDAITRGLPQPGEAPFVAALPKAALANPDGPLALVAHLDLAWSYAFRDLDHGATSRPGVLTGVLRSALQGDRIGVANRSLLGQLAVLDAEIAAVAARRSAAAYGRTPDPTDAVRHAHLWMLRQDIAGYVLLGDPAARLAVGPALPDLDALEAAVAALTLGTRGSRDLARELGIDRRTLEDLAARYRAAGRAALAR